MKTQTTPNQISKVSTNLQAIKASVMDIAGLMRARRPTLDFIFSGFLRGTVGILAATSGTGKSFWVLGLSIALCCRSLNKLGISYKSEIDVVYFSLEEPSVVVEDRVYSMLENASQEEIDVVDRRLKIVSFYGKCFDIEQYKEAISQYLAENSNVALVIVDTFSRSHSKQENDTDEMALLLKETFEALAFESNAGVLILHHLNKAGSQSGDKSIGAMRGAIVLSSNTRWKANMTLMSEAEAATFSDPDFPASTISGAPGHHKKFVMLSEECSYSAWPTPVWLRRRSNGVLEPVTLHSICNGRGSPSSPISDKKGAPPSPASDYKPWGGGYKVGPH